MRRMMTIMVLVAAVSVANAGVVGKDGSTLPDATDLPINVKSPLQAVWEYNTGGSMDFVPDTGGSWDGWGTHFMFEATNNTGESQLLEEIGIPCGGVIASEWNVWLDTMPSTTSGGDFSGPFTPTSSDDVTFPPTVYTYIDVSASNIMVPDGTTIYVGYTNPGIAGQTTFNGVVTWAWYGGVWDSDEPWGRTAIGQVRGNPAGPGPTPTPDPSQSNPVPTLSPTSIVMLVVILAGIGVAILFRRR